MEMHPIHESYFKACPSNSAERFFELLDQLPGKERDDCLIPFAITVVQPNTRNPDRVRETVGSLFEERVSYSRFKAKLGESVKLVPEELLVLAVVHRLLSTVYGCAHFDVEKIRANHRRIRWLGLLAGRRADDQKAPARTGV